MNKKGGIFDLFLMMAAIFIIIVITAVFIYAFGVVNDEMEDVSLQLDRDLTGVDFFNETNFTEAHEVSFGVSNSAMSTARWFVLGLILGYVFLLLAANFFIKPPPFYLVAHILITLLAVIFSVYISNVYEELMTNATLGSTFTSMGVVNWIMLYLPFWIAVLGIFSGIILYSTKIIFAEEI